MSVHIPDSHRDLIDGKVVATIATILPNGQPHLSAVFYSFDGNYVHLSTEVGRQKDKNLRHNPQVAFLAIDPANPLRYLEIRGVVAQIVAGQDAVKDITALVQKYIGEAAQVSEPEKWVLFKVEPTKIFTTG